MERVGGPVYFVQPEDTNAQDTTQRYDQSYDYYSNMYKDKSYNYYYQQPQQIDYTSNHKYHYDDNKNNYQDVNNQMYYDNQVQDQPQYNGEIWQSQWEQQVTPSNLSIENT